MTDVCLVSLWEDSDPTRRLMPLGALHLVSALRGAGFDAEVRDIQLMERSIPDHLDSLLDDAAPVLGVSLMADKLPAALLALERHRAHHPEQLILLGGPGPGPVAEPLLSAFSFIDAVCVGEGEECLVDAVRAHLIGDALADIPGLVARRGAEVVRAPDRPPIADLDRLAYPARLDASLLASYDVCSVVTSRGCPYACRFCSAHSVWGRTLRRRSVESIVSELSWLLGERPEARIIFDDDTFTSSRRRVVELCRAFHREGLKFSWGCTARVGRLDHDLLVTMAEAGCESLFIGVEAGSDRILNSIGKGFEVRAAVDTVLMAAERVHVTAHAIWGYPEEELEDFYQTYLLLSYLMAHGVTTRVSHFVPFPGSPLVDAYRGLLLPPMAHPYPRLLMVPPGTPEASLVESEPTIFLPFYSLETPRFETKQAFAAEYHSIVDPSG